MRLVRAVRAYQCPQALSETLSKQFWTISYSDFKACSTVRTDSALSPNTHLHYVIA